MGKNGPLQQTCANLTLTITASFVRLFVLVVAIGVQRIVRIKEQVGQSKGNGVPTKRPPTSLSQLFQVHSILSQALLQSLLPGLIPADRMAAVLEHSLDCETQQIDSITGRKIELQLV